MQIKDPGMFSRGKILLPPSPHINADSLMQELQNSWGGQGFTVYKTALIGADLVLKKSGWTGIALKVNQSPAQTEILFNAFAPSALVRILAMGIIPILIVNSTSWKPLLAQFKTYVQSSPFFTGQMAGAAHPQMGAGAPQQQGYPQAPAQQPQQGYPQPGQQPGQPPQGYPPQGGQQGGGQWQ